MDQLQTISMLLLKKDQFLIHGGTVEHLKCKTSESYIQNT